MLASIRPILVVLVLSLCFFAQATAVNQVRVYVPAQNGLAVQQMSVGIPSDIYVEMTNDVDVLTMQVPIEFSSASSTTLWPAILEADITWESMVIYPVFNDVTQDGTWPDTVFFLSMLMDGQPSQPPGTATIFRFTVTPSAEGLVHLTSPSYSQNSTDFTLLFETSGGQIFASFIGPDIEIIDVDCNDNGVHDSLDIINETSPDCNENWVPDECDIADGTSLDENSNGIPDECDGPDPDCNNNGIPDDLDIFCGISFDCNENGIPDECDIADGTSLDENSNGVPDECDPENAPNRIRVYVPAHGDLAEGQLQIGVPGDIYVEVTNDYDLMYCELPIEFSSENGPALWPEITESDIDWGPFEVASVLNNFSQNGIWPDTVFFFTTLIYDTQLLAPDTTNIFKITVTPSDTGIVHLTSPIYMYNSMELRIKFSDGSGTTVYPAFVGPDIEIVNISCCLDGYSGNTNCDTGNLRNLADITRLIDNVYITKAPLCCIEEGNVNGDAGGLINLADITRLIDHVYIGKTPTAACLL